MQTRAIELHELLRAMGRKGGMARVKKGFAALTPEQRREMGRRGQAAKKERAKQNNA